MRSSALVAFGEVHAGTLANNRKSSPFRPSVKEAPDETLLPGVGHSTLAEGAGVVLAEHRRPLRGGFVELGHGAAELRGEVLRACDAAVELLQFVLVVLDEPLSLLRRDLQRRPGSVLELRSLADGVELPGCLVAF